MLASLSMSYLVPFALQDFGDRLGGHQSTPGAISVHINSNENTDSHRAQNWIDFDANWVDASWHHIAVTWEFDSGATKVGALQCEAA